MWEITKHFDFCYGHRVHTQQLDAELSCNSSCKCRHLHGHQGKLKITLSSAVLTNGMVTDFHHLNWFKKWLDSYFDHKMILDTNDPYLASLLKGLGLEDYEEDVFKVRHPIGSTDLKVWVCDIESLDFVSMTKYDQEVLEGLTLVNFVPTSENLAKFVHEWVSTVMNEHCVEMCIYVDKVVFEETPKSSSTYSRG